MGTSNIFLCVLFLCGALGLTMSPARGRLRYYTCSLAKPCYPVPTKCQDDEACSISIGTSGCLPRAQCPLPSHQDLCNMAASPWQLTSLLASLPLLVASFAG
uniref:UPAR/Ly6 domain-containing protein n=1 Tax=Mandrillus leucophaeus TaxID=9568 RepID=A0A2K5YHJ8_MANLE